VIDWFLGKDKNGFLLEDADLAGVPRLPCLSAWGKDAYRPDIMKCLVVKPDEYHTGFFVAKLRRA